MSAPWVNSSLQKKIYKDDSVDRFNRIRLLKDISRQIASLPLSSRSRKLLIECEKELSK